MQISLTGFLERKTPAFCSELWALLISAQESVGGIPAIFLEKKKEELKRKKEEVTRVSTEIDTREKQVCWYSLNQKLKYTPLLTTKYGAGDFAEEKVEETLVTDDVQLDPSLPFAAQMSKMDDVTVKK